MKILVPDTINLDLPTPDDEVVVYEVDKPIPPGEHRDAEVLVVWRNTSDNLADAAREMRQLRLVQTLAAGPDSVLAAGFGGDNVAITSGRSLHDGPRGRTRPDPDFGGGTPHGPVDGVPERLHLEPAVQRGPVRA